MTASQQDIYRSLLKHVASAVAPIPLLSADAKTSTTLPKWLDIQILSFAPWQDQRNADFQARGTLRLRGFWREAPTGGASAIDQSSELAQAAQDALRGQDVAVMDYESAGGTIQVGVASFSEVPMNTLEPSNGVGIVLCDAEFLFA